MTGSSDLSGSSDPVVFDTSADAGALVYSHYAMSAGIANLVRVSGGAPTQVASGWVSHALFVENGRRIAIVMLSGNTLFDGSIDVVDPATGTRTSLATGVNLNGGEYLFTPERLGYYVGSTSASAPDLVIARLDMGDQFVVSGVNNVWRQSPDKRWLAVYTASEGLRTIDLDAGTVHFASSRPVQNLSSPRIASAWCSPIGIFHLQRRRLDGRGHAARGEQRVPAVAGRAARAGPAVDKPAAAGRSRRRGRSGDGDRRREYGVTAHQPLFQGWGLPLFPDRRCVQGGVDGQARRADPDDGDERARRRLRPRLQDGVLRR